MATLAVSTIVGLARDLMRTETGSDVPAVGNEFMFQIVGFADNEMKRAFRRGGGNTPQSIAKETGFNLVTDTNLAEDITDATTDFDVDDSASFPSAGAFVIWDDDMFDVGFFTGNASDNLSGITDIAFDHDDGDAVQLLYALPSNFKNFRKAEGYGDGVQLNGDPLTYMDGPPTSGHFSKIDDGTTVYLWLPKGASGKASTIYDKTTDTIDSVNDIVSFSDEYGLFYAWRCIELGVFGRGDVELMATAKAKGDAEKLDLLKDRNVGRRVRVRPLSMLVDVSDSIFAANDE